MATNNGSIFNKLRTRANETVSRVKHQIAEKGSAVIFVILALISIAVLIAFLVIRLKSSSSNGVLIVGDPLQLYNMSSQIVISQSSIPATVNGQEFSFSMWLYLVDFVSTNDGPQLIFMRSSDGTTVGTANPIVAFDGSTNKLYVSIRTNQSVIPTTPTDFYKPQVSKYLTATIDYFPLQRWVNVIGVLKDDSLSLYMNGYLYTVVNVVDLMSNDPAAARPVFSSSTGNLYVGATSVQGVRDSRAYITQFNYYNFAVTPTTIQTVYKTGPSSTTFFAKLGLAGYGLRSPIYRVEA